MVAGCAAIDGGVAIQDGSSSKVLAAGFNFSPLDDPGDAVHFLSPLGPTPPFNAQGVAQYGIDGSLLPLLVVNVCDPSGVDCPLLASMDADTSGSGRLKIAGGKEPGYSTVWKPGKNSKLSVVRVEVGIVGMLIAELDVTLTANPEVSRSVF